MEAYHLGHWDIVREVLKREDVDVNVRDNRGRTIFYLASVEDRWDVVLQLLRHDKVDVNAQGIHSRLHGPDVVESKGSDRHGS